jgi:UDP-N-acetylmuramoyl-L-alanyl-D-glutamate--2,6-diaminopimelate ligase
MCEAITLPRLFEGLDGVAPEIEVSGMQLDSRKIVAGDLFLATTGFGSHAGKYIEVALNNGAVAIAVEPPFSATGFAIDQFPVPAFWSRGLTHNVSEIAGRLFKHPSRVLNLVGVTGTNGKSSVSHFIAEALAESGPCGLMGTLGSGLYGELSSTGFTTPDPVQVQEQLASMVQRSSSHCVMEISSHGLDQGRVAALDIDTAIFTNLTRDHLDYHETIEHYGAAKAKLFAMPGLKSAVINIDDRFGRTLLGQIGAGIAIYSYSIDDRSAAIHTTELSLHQHGLKMNVVTPWGEGELNSHLLGRFNASNLLAALAGIVLSGIDFDTALERLSRVSTVTGRMQSFSTAGSPLVVVDFAHTPDALEQALAALKEHCQGQLWAVFGAGGDRDRSKRPEMGEVAARIADHVVVTSDNPRREDPLQIIHEIQKGIPAECAANIEVDRRTAIEYALANATAGDIVLVAGKGHETGQIFADRTIEFSDLKVVAEILGMGGEVVS